MSLKLDQLLTVVFFLFQRTKIRMYRSPIGEKNYTRNCRWKTGQIISCEFWDSELSSRT